MIGREPGNHERMHRLEKLQEAGYRGTVSVTAFYAADIYEIQDDKIYYLGRYRYYEDGFILQNFTQLYKRWVTHRPKEPAVA